MKRLAALLVMALLLVDLVFAESAPPVPVPPVRPDPNILIPAHDDLLHGPGDPVLYCSKTEVHINERFALSWYEGGANWAVLFVSYNGGGFESLGFVDCTKPAYYLQHAEVGKYTYCLMTLKNGESWKQSNFVDVYVTTDEEGMCRQLAARGMDNVWNILFIVYRNVQLPGFRKSFSDGQIAAVKNHASRYKSIVENLSDGRMRIGTVDFLVEETPITSTTNVGYSLPGLSYGPGKDVDFNYIFDHKDINLVGVYAPLIGYRGASDWLGLGGGYMTVNGKRIYTTIISDIYTQADTWTIDGYSYPTSVAAQVHEMLHAVETNSRDNGWGLFEALHDYEQSSYENTTKNGNYPWYHDLMRNQLKSGKHGFLKYSYYVYHHGIPAGMTYGLHVDYDGVARVYINGMPHSVDIVIPNAAQRIEAEAFKGIPGKNVYIPPTVQYIDGQAFGSGITVYGYWGTVAQQWSQAKGYTFVPIQ